MAEKKEVNELDRADRSEKAISCVIWVSTISYILGIGYLFGCDVWCLTQTNRIGEAGDFLAGFITPLVFLWLIYGHLLQRKELKETRKTLGEQVEVLRDQREAERRRLMPYFDLIREPLGGGFNLTLRNTRGAAHALTFLQDSGKEDERYYQRWSVELPGGSRMTIKEITEGPILLKDGESPPGLEIQRMTPQ